MGKGRPAVEQSTARCRASLRSAARRRINVAVERREAPASRKRRGTAKTDAPFGAPPPSDILSGGRLPRPPGRREKGLSPRRRGDDGVPRAAKNRGNGACLDTTARAAPAIAPSPPTIGRRIPRRAQQAHQQTHPRQPHRRSASADIAKVAVPTFAVVYRSACRKL